MGINSIHLTLRGHCPHIHIKIRIPAYPHGINAFLQIPEEFIINFTLDIYPFNTSA